MSKLKMCLICAALSIGSASVYSDNSGTITRMLFSGSDSIWGTSHNDIVQIELSGGFSAPGCDTTYAAINKQDEHLVSAALAAYMAGKSVSVQINNGRTYWDGSRCIIRDLFIHQ